MSVLMGTVFANYIKQQQNETLKAAAQEVVATIELARQESISNEIPNDPPPGPNVCTPISSFRGFGIAAETNIVRLDFYCPTNKTIKTVDLKKYKFITISPVDSFYFKNLKGETSDDVGHTLCISHSALSTKYKITISTLGKIDVYASQASCP